MHITPDATEDREPGLDNHAMTKTLHSTFHLLATLNFNR